jgi:hypothetical protein
LLEKYFNNSTNQQEPNSEAFMITNEEANVVGEELRTHVEKHKS